MAGHGRTRAHLLGRSNAAALPATHFETGEECPQALLASRHHESSNRQGRANLRSPLPAQADCDPLGAHLPGVYTPSGSVHRSYSEVLAASPNKRCPGQEQAVSWSRPPMLPLWTSQVGAPPKTGLVEQGGCKPATQLPDIAGVVFQLELPAIFAHIDGEE